MDNKNRVNECYRYEPIEVTDKPLFSQEIDATYVLHLENNGRYETVLDQLHQYPPTKIIYIAFNPGFRSCPKEPYVIISLQDIVDAFIHVFIHAEEHGYRNILVLEDDFFFDPCIRNEPEHVAHIESFLHKLDKKENFMYFLGSLPFLQRPVDWNGVHYSVSVTAGTHACIYSPAMRRKMLSLDQKLIRDWDVYNNNHCKKRYGYHRPLCYQLFTATENQKNWIGSDGPYEAWNKWWGQMGVTIFNAFGLDKHIVPGYPFFYHTSKLVFFILWTLFFLVLYEIINILRKKPKEIYKQSYVLLFLLILFLLPSYILVTLSQIGN